MVSGNMSAMTGGMPTATYLGFVGGLQYDEGGLPGYQNTNDDVQSHVQKTGITDIPDDGSVSSLGGQAMTDGHNVAQQMRAHSFSSQPTTTSEDNMEDK